MKTVAQRVSVIPKVDSIIFSPRSDEVYDIDSMIWAHDLQSDSLGSFLFVGTPTDMAKVIQSAYDNPAFQLVFKPVSKNNLTKTVLKEALRHLKPNEHIVIVKMWSSTKKNW